MEIADKEILLKDLCLRLPYKVICEGVWIDEHRSYVNKEVGILEGVDGIFMDEGPYITINGMQCEFFTVKPYLRPMSSMTTEEICAITNIIGEGFTYNDDILSICTEDIVKIPFQKINELINFLYARHLDFNHLIEKDLALEASEEMYV